MKRALPITLSLTALSLLALSAVALAQNKDGRKIYRWVDKNGKVQYSETLPAEAKDAARTEFNRTGRATGSVDRAMTPEERAAFEKEQAEAAKLAEEEAAKRRAEQAMMQVFTTEEDLRRSFNERINLTKQSIESTQASIGSQRANLVALLADASEDELGGRPVDAKRVASIRELHASLLKSKSRLDDYRVELSTLDGELEAAVLRFRELKRLQSPAPAAAPTTPSSSP